MLGGKEKKSGSFWKAFDPTHRSIQTFEINEAVVNDAKTLANFEGALYSQKVLPNHGRANTGAAFMKNFVHEVQLSR